MKKQLHLFIVREGGDFVKLTSRLQKDFLVSTLRTHMSILKNALDGIEYANDVDSDFIDESLKRVEVGLRKLRKVAHLN